MLPVKWERNKSSFSAEMSPPLFCSISHLVLLPHLFFSWVTLGMHHGLLPHHSQPSSPSGAPGPGLSHSPASNAHLAFRNPAHEVCLSLLGGTLGMEGDLAHPSSSPGLQQKGTPVTPQSTTSRVHVPHATVSDRLTFQSVCGTLCSWW